MKKFLLMNFAFLILLSFAFAEEEKSTAVIVSGYGLTEEDALKNAFAAAVEQAVGTLVSSTLLVENSELVNEKILSLSNGFIETYKKLSTTKQGGLFKVTIEARVKQGKLQQSVNLIFESRASVSENAFAQAFTKIKKEEDAKKIIIDKFPAIARKFAEIIRMEVVGLEIDTDNASSNQVAYKIWINHHTPLSDYKAVVSELDYYLSQIADNQTVLPIGEIADASITLSKYHSKNSINLVEIINGTIMVRHYELTPDLIAVFAKYFTELLLGQIKNTRYYVEIKYKDGATSIGALHPEPYDDTMYIWHTDPMDQYRHFVSYSDVGSSHNFFPLSKDYIQMINTSYSQKEISSYAYGNIKDYFMTREGGIYASLVHSGILKLSDLERIETIGIVRK